jgi:peptidoglycan hydrolase CwlO-like protein
MEATIEKQVERSWQSKTSVILVALTIMGSYFALTSKFEDDGKKYENHEVRLNQLEADKKEMRDDIKDIKKSNEQILILLQNKADRK